VGAIEVFPEWMQKAIYASLSLVLVLILFIGLLRYKVRVATEKVKYSELLFKTFMDYTPAYVYIKDKSLNHVYRNRMVNQVNTIAPDYKTSSAKTVFEPHIAELVEKTDNEILNSEIKQIELQYQCYLNGKNTWLHDYKFYLNLPNGKPAIGGLSLDITTLKETEFELIKAKERAEESEKQFRNLFENAADAIFIADEETGIILDANQGAERLMEMECHEIIGIHQSLLHPREKENFSVDTFTLHKQLDEELRLKTFFENIIVRKDGTEVPVEILATKVYYKGKNCLVGTFRNITERKHAERLLQEKNDEIASRNQELSQTNQELTVSKEKIGESEERFLLAMKASNDGLFDWNLETNEIYYSPGWKKMLGYEDHELPNDFSVWEKTTASDDVKKSWELQQMLITKQVDRFVLEFKMKHNDGHWVDILSRAEAIFNDSGKAIRIVGTHTDITERKLYIQEIHKLNEELEQRVTDRTAQLEAANKELEAFSYSVSHDLRTPLRALNGFSNILIEEYSSDLDDEGKRLLTIISQNATKMGHLIDDLLSFARLGRIEIMPSEIYMKKMAAAVYNELVPESDKEKIRFTLRNIPAALGDSSMVKQVWVNLIGNAIKFTSKKTDRLIEVGVIAGNKENIYFVKDNGAGFDMAHAAKLFGVFQRLHTIKEFDGIGAGLAIVRRIILRHNGRIWAEGKVNEGATFYFTLPSGK